MNDFKAGCLIVAFPIVIVAIAVLFMFLYGVFVHYGFLVGFIIFTLWATVFTAVLKAK